MASAYPTTAAIVQWLSLAGVWRPGHGAPVILGLLGWLGCLIAGQAYKIVPFLVRYRASRAGRENVPLLRDMYDERAARVGMWGVVAAALLLTVGAAGGVPARERLGAAGCPFGYGVLAWNLVQVLRG